MLDHILIPLDGSELGELALVYAKELAVVFDSEIHLVSVCEGKTAEYRHMIQIYIEKIAEQLRLDINKTDATVKPVILDGDPAEKILEYAQQKNTDLIVVVSHGHSGILPWTMGSTANKIVHGSNVSILLVRAKKVTEVDKELNVFGKILLPLDGSPASEQALPYAMEIAEKLGAQVIFLGIVESGQHVHTIGGQNYIHFSEQQVVAMKEEMLTYLDCTVKKFDKKNARVSKELRLGNAAEEIIKFSKDANINLIVMSCHGKSGMRKWVFGSVSNKVLHSSKIPLLLVKAAQDTTL